MAIIRVPSAAAIAFTLCSIGVEAALADPISDRIRIQANLSELPAGVQELASFLATFPNNPMLAPATISLTEPGNMTAESDNINLAVARPGGAGAGSMDLTLTFVSDPEIQPPAAGAIKIPETGASIDLTNRPDIFGAPLPFSLAVQSDIETQPSTLPSDMVTIDANIDEAFGAETMGTLFRGIFPNDPNLKNGILAVLTEPGSNDLTSDFLTLDVRRIIDAMGNVLAMDVLLGFVSDLETQPMVPPGAVVIGPETGGLMDLTNRPDIWGSRLPFTLQVVSDVPEPSGLSLLGLSVVSLIGLRRCWVTRWS